MERIKIQGKRRKVNIGDMFSVINIENRNILPSATSHEYREVFTDKTTDEGIGRLANGEMWANVESVSGVTVFDATGIEQQVTHIFLMRWLDITTEQWIRYNGNRYNIVTIENFDGRDEFIKLNTIFKGTVNNYNNVI